MAQKDRLSWSTKMDDALVDAFYQQYVEGNKIDGTFTSKAYENIVIELQLVLHMDITKDQLKNRMKTLKSNYGECFDQLTKSGFSGFSWDPATRMLGAEPEVWDRLIEKYPKAIKWRSTPIPDYEKMKQIYGKDRATGERAETAKEKNKRLASATNDMDSPIEVDELLTQNNVTLDGDDDFDSSFNFFTSPGPRKASKLTPISKKKKSKTSVTIEEYHVGMIGAMNNMAGAFHEGYKIMEKKGGNKKDDDRLNNALLEAGFERKVIPKCVLFLVRNCDIQEAFFQIALDQRKEFLAEEMGLLLDP